MGGSRGNSGDPEGMDEIQTGSSYNLGDSEGIWGSREDPERTNGIWMIQRGFGGSRANLGDPEQIWGSRDDPERTNGIWMIQGGSGRSQGDPEGTQSSSGSGSGSVPTFLSRAVRAHSQLGLMFRYQFRAPLGKAETGRELWEYPRKSLPSKSPLDSLGNPGESLRVRLGSRWIPGWDRGGSWDPPSPGSHLNPDFWNCWA